MSHLTRIATDLVDLELVAAACAAMGLPVQWDGVVRSLQGEVRTLPLIVPNGPGRPYAVGFAVSAAGQPIAIVSDFLGMPWTREAFAQELTRAYAVEAAVRHAERKGYRHIVRERQPDGSVVVRAEQGGVGFTCDVSVEGRVDLEATGFTDRRCLAATSELETSLGAEVAPPTRVMKRRPDETGAILRERLPLTE